MEGFNNDQVAFSSKLAQDSWQSCCPMISGLMLLSDQATTNRTQKGQESCMNTYVTNASNQSKMSNDYNASLLGSGCLSAYQQHSLTQTILAQKYFDN
ncbi:hypothetical protein GDO78_006180 [Eleutherodactylus coqui]|uniref:Uncharacterized protein n=1 Tax=Eleutherodactylus coqui TaxID=57060 RepID=A0A8J6FNC6_ELECQ|nr:hypothetical protein GDO78_006180 [Eleutherodactylus coqui]